MRFRVRHQTVYTYDEPVTASYGLLHQLPGDQDGQRSAGASIRIDPEPTWMSSRVDYFGNRVMTCAVRHPHQRLTVHADSIVDTGPRQDALTQAQHIARAVPWESIRDQAGEDLDAWEFSLDSPRIVRSRDLGSYAAPSFAPGTGLLAAIDHFCARVHHDFAFDPKATNVDTPAEDALRKRRGVCQDFAHVMVGGLRSLGLPACYVSGYLETDPPPGVARMVGADRTHAWVGVYVGAGTWYGIDPTNAQPAGVRYVTTARGRDYSDVPPMKGVIFTDATTSTLAVSVDVARLETGPLASTPE